LELIFIFALCAALIAVCFAVLFWRLASRFNANACTAEWLNGFSLESYAPMERLLDRRDLEFLASQPGYHPDIAKRLMAERRKVFVAYLGNLIRDFNQLTQIGKLMIVYAIEDRQEFARGLWRQQMRFYWIVCAVRLQLALYPLGWRVADVHPLVAALAAMRSQVQLLAQPSQAAVD
jgi:hypothetical protein